MSTVLARRRMRVIHPGICCSGRNSCSFFHSCVYVDESVAFIRCCQRVGILSIGKLYDSSPVLPARLFRLPNNAIQSSSSRSGCSFVCSGHLNVLLLGLLCKLALEEHVLGCTGVACKKI